MIDLNLEINAENTLIAFSVCLAALVGLKLLVIIIYAVINPRVEENSISLIVFNQLQKIPLMMLLVISLYAGLMNSGIEITDQALIVIQTLLLVYIFINVVNLINRGIKDATKRLLSNSRNSSQKSVITYLSIVARTTVWIIGVAIILENFGLDVSALVAGLGLSGFAIAFALRSLIKDLIASIVILLERPIKLGDRIVVAKKKGYVQKIGIKSTHLIQEDGRMYIIPNSFITEKPVKNYKGDESEDIVLEIEVKKKKDMGNITDALRKILVKDFEEILLPETKVFLSEIGEENNLYRIQTSLKDSIDMDLNTERIIARIEKQITASKLKPIRITLVTE